LPFSFRHFLRQTPSSVLRAFFEQHGVEFDDAVDWLDAEHMIARRIADAMDGMCGEQVAPLISALEPAHALSDERGMRALVNAADSPEAMLAAFAEAECDHERALRVLVQHPKVFERAEDIRYFDYRVEGSYGRRFRTRQNAIVSREPADLEAFQHEVSSYFRPIDGSGRSCVAEIIDRNADGTVQITLFVEGLASNSVGFDDGGLYRRPQPTTQPSSRWRSMALQSGRLPAVGKATRARSRSCRTSWSAAIRYGSSPRPPRMQRSPISRSRSWCARPSIRPRPP
jgi:hypothetical protein